MTEHFFSTHRLSFAALVIAASLAACSNASPDAATPPTPVRIAKVATGPASPPIEASGIVATRDEVRLSFKVGGVVSRVRVQDGEAVRRGQLLAEIEPTEINAQVESAWQLAEKARRDLERGERLYADQVISLEQLEGLRTQAATSQAQLRTARFNRGYAAIVAPRDGVVLRKLVEERELVPAGQPVLVLGGKDRGYIVRGSLSDREIVQVRLGDRVTASMDAWPGVQFQGRINEIAGAADERSGMFPIEIKLDEIPDRLATGLVAKLSIQPASAGLAQLAYVPASAVLDGDRNRASVFLLQDGKAVKRAVTVAFLSGTQVALFAGVNPGDTVIAEGALYLVDGEAVRVVAGGA